jgi:hypothetical protein
MRIHGKATRRASVALALAGCLLGAAPAHAMNVCIRVAQYTDTMPDGTTVRMWGYRVASSCTAAQLASATSAINQPVTSPGAAITVPPGDTTLNVTLVNRASANTALGELALPVPTSFVLQGHNTTMTPVFKTNATVNAATTTSDCTPGTSLDCRMRSFTHEAAPGGTATYTYTNVRPGTYMYHSGTLPQIQVQMGLYGLLRKNAPATVTAARVAYPGAASAPDQYAFDNEIALLLSEVDPAVHAAVAAGTFAGSTLAYDPKYFRVHRYAAPAATVPATGVISQPIDFTDNPTRGVLGITAGARQLVRVVNAGLQSRVPTLMDGHWFHIAEEGNVYPYPREQVSVHVPAGKSADLWFAPTLRSGTTAQRMAIYDRRLALTNNDASSVGGMLVRLSLTSTAAAPTIDVSGCPTSGTQGTPYACTVTATGTGTLAFALDSAPAGMTIDAGGAIAWTPNNDQAWKPLLGQTASNPVVVRVTDSNGRFAQASFAVAVANVDDAPVARDDAYDVRGGSLTVGAARSVLVNDADPDGDPLGGATLVAAPTNGSVTLNADGTFTYTAGSLPATGSTTTTFTYKVTANGKDSNVATVTLTLYANSAPTAVDDVAAMAFALTPATLYVDVLANDYDVDGNLAPATLAIAGAPNRGGTATVVTAGCPVATRPCIAFTPAPNFRGTDALTYTVADTLGAVSRAATLRVNVQ